MAIGEVLQDNGQLVESCALIAFGSSVDDVTVLGGAFDLNSSLDPLSLNAILEMSFTLPRDGTLETLSGFYTNLVEVNLPEASTTTVTLQIYRRPATDAPNTNIFTAYGPLVELLPPFSGSLTVGQTAAGTESLGDLPVLTGDRLVLVACADRNGGPANIETLLTGYISAGLEIA